MPADVPRLISRSCTTGWFEDTRGGAPAQTARRGIDGRVGVDGVRGAVATGPAAERRRRQEQRCIVVREIRTARLRRGVLNSRLGVELHDGTPCALCDRTLRASGARSGLDLQRPAAPVDREVAQAGGAGGDAAAGSTRDEECASRRQVVRFVIDD